MGRGRSGAGKGKKGGGGVKTPSGITYDQFMNMSDDQKIQVMTDIINDKKIVVPNYLDDSTTTKVMYALGMNNKPTVVSDSKLDALSGEQIFRTVNDTGFPPPYATDITDQFRTGDFTQMSGSGGSAYGRALYFATDFGESQIYGDGITATMMRGKISKKANIVTEKKLDNMMKNDKKWKTLPKSAGADDRALYALSHGIDGWKGSGYGKTYRMIVNRGILTMSSQDKDVSNAYRGRWHTSPNK